MLKIMLQWIANFAANYSFKRQVLVSGNFIRRFQKTWRGKTVMICSALNHGSNRLGDFSYYSVATELTWTR